LPVAVKTAAAEIERTPSIKKIYGGLKSDFKSGTHFLSADALENFPTLTAGQVAQPFDFSLFFDRREDRGNQQHSQKFLIGPPAVVGPLKA
jgi:hypothetical protein